MLKKLLPELLGAAAFVGFLLVAVWPINKVCDIVTPWYYYPTMFVAYLALFVLVIVINFKKRQAKK
jgi:hypothetical protein